MVWLNLSNTHAFHKGREPEPLEPIHRPWFGAFPKTDEPIKAAHARLVRLIEEASDDTEKDPLAKALGVRDPVRYRSFWNHGRARDIIPVVARRSYWVPDISDALFFEHGFYTVEHDIPYMERAHADLVAEKGWWMWDTKGHPATLKVLTYDIETTQFGSGARDIPIDMIGYADFDVEYEAAKDLDKEQFDFEFRHLPNDWAEQEVKQLIAHNRDEELDNLMTFTQHVVKHDIIAGHNVLGFDNKQIFDRIQEALRLDQRNQDLSPGMRAWFEEFTNVWSRKDRSFHFGTSQDIAVFHPTTLDTFHAARKFYFFHDDFTLKGLAPWLGIEIEDRVILTPEELGLDAKTKAYNKQDVQEQLGITQLLLAQALPMAFTVNLPLESLLTGGNTKMWDHMALIRARRNKKMMPATCRAAGVARGIHRLFEKPFPTRSEIAEAVQRFPPEDRQSSANKELVRVVKQGPEMPFWCEHPGVIVKPHGGDEPYGYAIPGGMTLKPDSDLKSHFTPWFHVVAADVGAMYPTILKARNLTADTVRPAYKEETPDDWIWLFELDEDFVRSGRYHVREADEEKEGYTRGRGYMVGVVRDKDMGLVNLAMTGILDTIQKVKTARAEAKRKGRPDDEVKIHDMTYASLKAARNAGTHGILVAVNVSCRQFNVWGGANITTIGQKILHDTLQEFEAKGIRVVYGDTDGIYMGCSRSAGNLPHMAAALGADVDPEEAGWITLPDAAIEAVRVANRKWRDELKYEGFELEAEVHDAMVFVVHKNYLIFDAKDDKVVMETKGNNFKGSDKAPLAQHLLGDIMRSALRDVARWDDAEAARESMQSAIKRATKEVMATVQVAKTPWDDLILRQGTSPVRSYEPNPDGTLRTQAVRAAALEDLLGEAITSTRKLKFIVCKEPLPLYRDPRVQERVRERLARAGHQLQVKLPRNKGLKPIEYMWPADQVRPEMVDWDWYKGMVEEYVKGAFGFPSLELAVQRDLSSWF